MDITQELFSFQDRKYRDFHSGLIPNISKETVIGVRVPELRKLVKRIPEEDRIRLISELPHSYYEENILHGIIISGEKSFEACIEKMEAFLPYIDNWAVCDIISPKVFKKHEGKLIEHIKRWISSERIYTSRFGIRMLMVHYLEENFREEYLQLPASVVTEEYYLRMMIAWFFATALAKQWDASVIYLEENRLERWVHNKTIQKAIESYRITDEQKKYLRTLRR